MKKVFTLSENNRTSEVFYNGQTEEYTVMFYRGDRHVKDADYFTDDYDDAKNTAQFFIKHGK